MTSTTQPQPARWLSPLRFPGGKPHGGRVGRGIRGQFGQLDVEVWIEPFAGGAGAGLHLLDRGVVDEIWLTERNPALAAFWRTVTTHHDELAARIRACRTDMGTWHAARELVAAQEDGTEVADLDLASAALVINLRSRSGMVKPARRADRRQAPKRPLASSIAVELGRAG